MGSELDDRIMAASGSEVTVTSLRTVVRDGWYNAFTDLTYWNEMYWLCYRRGTRHGAVNSVEVVMRPNDLRRWRQARLSSRSTASRGVVPRRTVTSV